MKKTYTQVVQQIESLQAEAEKLRRAELTDVIARIRQAIDVYKLTAADLGFTQARVQAAGVSSPFKRKSAAKSGTKNGAVVKFRNDSGGTWGGIGKRPQWLRDALADGKKLDDFLVR